MSFHKPLSLYELFSRFLDDMNALVPIELLYSKLILGYIWQNI